MNNGQNIARSRNLEELARAAKQYTLQEILDVTEAVATELEGLTDFTGATSVTGGLSGFVPAPQAGDESKFLRGDGSWATVPSRSVEVIAGGSVAILNMNPKANQWTHLAIVKDGSNFFFFEDGSLVWNPTTTVEADNSICIGGNPYSVAGERRFSRFRYFDGVALWTSDFTPPTAADYA